MKDWRDEPWSSHSNASCLPIDGPTPLYKGDVVRFKGYKDYQMQRIVSVGKKWYTIREGHYDLENKMRFTQYRKRRVLVGTPFDIVQLNYVSTF